MSSAPCYTTMMEAQRDDEESLAQLHEEALDKEIERLSADTDEVADAVALISDMEGFNRWLAHLYCGTHAGAQQMINRMIDDSIDAMARKNIAPRAQ